MPKFRVLKLLPKENLDVLLRTKTAPAWVAGDGFESNSTTTGLATVNARYAITPKALTKEERAMKRTIRIKGYDPETEELEDGEVQVPIWEWTPQQWAIFLGAVAVFIATVVNVVTGNPAGLPFAG